jgi:hypothetical protein
MAYQAAGAQDADSISGISRRLGLCETGPFYSSVPWFSALTFL